MEADGYTPIHLQAEEEADLQSEVREVKRVRAVEPHGGAACCSSSNQEAAWNTTSVPRVVRVRADGVSRQWAADSWASVNAFPGQTGGCGPLALAGYLA